VRAWKRSTNDRTGTRDARAGIACGPGDCSGQRLLRGGAEGSRLPLWTYISASEVQPYTLDGAHGFINRRVQINCDGAIAADCILLAKAIDDVLSGYSGVLPDPDETAVHGCFRTNVVDFFDDPGRTSRRILEYEIWFTQT
jgi:hypothetical protein